MQEIIHNNVKKTSENKMPANMHPIFHHLRPKGLVRPSEPIDCRFQFDLQEVSASHLRRSKCNDNEDNDQPEDNNADHQSDSNRPSWLLQRISELITIINKLYIIHNITTAQHKKLTQERKIKSNQL